MKKKEKTVCQIIRFRGKIEAFLVSIDEFAISSKKCLQFWAKNICSFALKIFCVPQKI